MSQETAVSVIREIIENLGGESDAETVVPALKDLEELLGEGGISQAVSDYMQEHGVSVGYSVTETGDLTVTIN